MSPVGEFCGLFIWQISARSSGKKSKKQPKLVSFAAAVALWTRVTLLIKLIGKLLNWKYKQDKNYAIFAKAKLFCQKGFVQVTPEAVMFTWENFHPGYRDLGNRAARLLM